MIRENYCDGRTHEEHCAWLDGLSDDESTIVHASIGIRYTFVMIAKTKALLLDDMPVGYRLRFLEWLNGCVDDRLTAAALAAVDPACPTALKMIDEMEPLGSNKA